jgi:hypothetical protein
MFFTPNLRACLCIQRNNVATIRSLPGRKKLRNANGLLADGYAITCEGGKTGRASVNPTFITLREAASTRDVKALIRDP